MRKGKITFPAGLESQFAPRESKVDVYFRDGNDNAYQAAPRHLIRLESNLEIKFTLFIYGCHVNGRALDVHHRNK